MMRETLRIMGILCVLIGSIIVLGSNQVSAEKRVQRGQMPIGAFRIFPKTAFSCLGRPAGYYADIETGCQVYHMCDGLGRQFSYSCPNTTLFQQRMLICDHWYMVNCSKAESDYAANLLIGQRDKPFVPEEENHLRTPRPDLLDRPYAPDYSGESFRNQYKDHRQISNEISDSDDSEKEYFNQVNSPSATRWSLPKPDVDIKPPSINNHHVRRNDVEENIAVDLGTSFSSNYNSSSDFSAETSNSKFSTKSTTPVRYSTTTAAPTTTTTIPPYIKPPSILYEPPFLYPIYNLNYTTISEDQEEYQQSSSTTFSTTPVPTVVSTTTTIKTTTPVPITSTTLTPTTEFTRRPTIFFGRPFSRISTTTAPVTSTTTESYDISVNSVRPQSEGLFSRDQFNGQPKPFEIKSRTTYATSTTAEPPQSVSTPFLELLPPEIDQLSQPAPFKPKSITNEPPRPSNLLLPPFQEFIQHDVATTQGPPIYFEWKIPSNGLEPPKLDSPTGVEDDNQPSDDAASAGSTTISENHTTNSPFAHNPFLAPIFSSHDQQSTQGSVRTPTARSIPKTSTAEQLLNSSVNHKNKEGISAKKSDNLAENSKDVDIQQLQKDYLIPDFLFPLENDARTGYEQSDVLNSFQLKIPERRDNEKPWYGENPDCPECHPSFVKPGTCEPCIRR